MTGNHVDIFRLNPLIYRPIVSMDGTDYVLICVLVYGRTYRRSYLVHRPSMARKSWTYFILLLRRVEIVVDIALNHVLLFLGVFAYFVRFSNVLKITSLDFNVLQATCLLKNFMLLLSGHMQELLLLDSLRLRRLFRFEVLFFHHHVLVARILDFFDVLQVDSVVIVLLRVWTDVRLKPSIRIPYLSIDCLSILKHHGDVDLLIILQPLIESRLR